MNNKSKKQLDSRSIYSDEDSSYNESESISSEASNNLLFGSEGAIEVYDNAVNRYEELLKKNQSARNSKIIWTLWFLLKYVVSFFKFFL